MTYKKYSFRFLLLFLVLCSCLLTNAQKKVLEMELNGLYYSLYDDMTAEVTRCKDFISIPHLEIPSFVFYKGIEFKVTSISSRAFTLMNDVESVTFPEHLSWVGSPQFSYRPKLTKFSISPNNPHFKVEDNCLYSKDGRTLLLVPTGRKGHFVVPSTVQTIGEEAFADCEDLTAVTIPEGVSVICDAAFWGCCQLTTVTLPETLVVLGDNVFSNCTALSSIHLPKNLESIPEGIFALCYALKQIDLPPSIETIESGAFYQSGIVSLDLPSSLKTIGDSAFCFCPDLQSMRIPEGVVTMGNSVFEDAESLVSVHLPASLQKMGQDVFSGCCALLHVSVPPANPYFSTADNALYNKDKTTLLMVAGARTGHFAVPATVTKIGETAFAYADISTVSLPEGLTTIDVAAFHGCRHLDGVILPKSLQAIESAAFADCERLTSISIPEGIDSISARTFFGCKRLCQLSLPIGLKRIGADAFHECISLASVRFPMGLNRIGEGAFSRCDRLSSVVFPKGLKTIDELAFYSCPALQSVSFPESLTTIGDRAFEDCSKLSIIRCFAEKRPLCYSSAFKGLPASAAFHIRKDADKLYGERFCGVVVKRTLPPNPRTVR